MNIKFISENDFQLESSKSWRLSDKQISAYLFVPCL